MQSLSQSEYAQHRGVSRMAVSKAVKAGRVKKDVNGKIDVAQADADWEANTKPQMHSPPTTPPGGRIETAESRAADSYGASRAIREAYQARLAKLEYERESGELIRADTVRNDAFTAARATRNMLGNIPARLSAILAGETDEKKIYRLLEDAIDDACRSLAEKVEAGAEH
ncbi:MAG: hypothetical protein Dbin4_02708 [Alphaproteobacteria bacterium]|nr:hypothetical protein [Alphaproteobacteria bacterium]